MENHYYNPTHPLKPYAYSLPATPGTLPPSNATRDKEPQVVQGKWPCWDADKGDWVQVEDHRKREGFPDMITRYGAEYPQDGTEYWLPGDTHETPARIMKEVGPLPDGAMLERPAKPEPTVFEKITEVQAPFLEQQTLAKSDFITARIEGDAELEAEAQADYQASIDAMKQATSEVTGG